MGTDRAADAEARTKGSAPREIEFREVIRGTVSWISAIGGRSTAGSANWLRASPSAAVIDSQSVKAPHGETRGYDAGKKIVGRKRHIAVDPDERLLMVNLTTADISDRVGAQAILKRSANASRG
jgi:hypothetical protein